MTWSVHPATRVGTKGMHVNNLSETLTELHRQKQQLLQASSKRLLLFLPYHRLKGHVISLSLQCLKGD